MEGCHVIIFIFQNPNPNFLLSFHDHGSRRRTSSPRRPPLHHQSAAARHHCRTTTPPSSRLRICSNSANLLRSHRSSTFHRNLHHFRSAHEPPSRLRLLRTSISRRNPTTTILQHHLLAQPRNSSRGNFHHLLQKHRNTTTDRALLAAVPSPLHQPRSHLQIHDHCTSSSFTHCSAVHATMNENEPWQPPFLHQQRTPSTRTSSVHKPPPQRLRRRRRRSSRAVIHKPP